MFLKTEKTEFMLKTRETKKNPFLFVEASSKNGSYVTYYHSFRAEVFWGFSICLQGHAKFKIWLNH